MEKLNQTDGKRYLYGKADEKFVKRVAKKTKPNATFSFKFRLSTHLQGPADAETFNRTDVPIVFKCSPDSLVNLCVGVLDALPLPPVYDWSIRDICKWLIETGFRQYQNAFRLNLITGRNMLLLDAAALSAMNITDFDHIRKITQGIRDLYCYQMTKFGRCLSLHPEFHNSLYKLVRLKTGAKYNLRRSDVWRKAQLIRQKESPHTHWEVLDRWLQCDKQPPYKELLGGARRRNLYACKAACNKDPLLDSQSSYHCSCMPPCECYSSKLHHRRPWLLKCLPHLKGATGFVESCDNCIPPCNCCWPSKSYQIHGVLTCLKSSFPHKYDYHFGLLHEGKVDQIYFSFLPVI